MRVLLQGVCVFAYVWFHGVACVVSCRVVCHAGMVAYRQPHIFLRRLESQEIF